MKIGDTKSFNRTPVIYGIKNTITSKWYVGSCLDLKDRFERHRYYLRHNQHHSSKLQRAYNLYGEDSFDVIILHNIEEGEDRFKLEQFYIEQYDCVANGYNMLERCIYVDNFNLSDIAKQNFLNYIDTLKKSVISINRLTGKTDGHFNSVTEAAKYFKTNSSNISRVCKGGLRYIKDHVFVYLKDFDELKDYRVEHHCKGKAKSESQKEKMSHNKKCAPIKQCDLAGNVEQTFYSITAVAKHLGVNKDSLRYYIDKGIPFCGHLYIRDKAA